MGTSDNGTKFYAQQQKVGFGERPAVVVVDVIKAFTDPNQLFGADYSEVVNHIKQLLDVAREEELPIFFMTMMYENEVEGGQYMRKSPMLIKLEPGSDLVEIDERLGRQSNEPLISKEYASSFFGTSLNAMLTVSKVDTLIVTGVSTSGCIRATAVDGMQYGYRVIVPEECVGDRGKGPHEANLFDINAKYGDVEPLENVLQELRKNEHS